MRVHDLEYRDTPPRLRSPHGRAAVPSGRGPRRGPARRASSPGRSALEGASRGRAIRNRTERRGEPEKPVRAKQGVRELAWTRLEEAGAARFPGARGRIPNFRGAEAAAELLAAQPEWRSARVVKANPDLPQLPVRARALAGGKRLYMAVPRLAD